ncbi:MAG: hypothetical protein ACP6IU_14160 [Candidatus Asgardarchaeia archaeon]
MAQPDSDSSDDIESILSEYYQNLPEKLKALISYATPIEIGFTVSENIQTALMYNEAFKGFLVAFRENDHEIRLTFVRTFIGPSKYAPAIATMEVFFENGLPKRKWFVNLMLYEFKQEIAIKELQNLLKDADFGDFLARVTEIGRKPIGQELVPIANDEKEHFMELFKIVSEEFKKAVKQSKFPVNDLINFIQEEKDKFPEVSDIFLSYLQGIQK